MQTQAARMSLTVADGDDAGSMPRCTNNSFKKNQWMGAYALATGANTT